MPIRDGFDPNHPLPFFLSGHGHQHEERGSLLLLNANILVLVASLVGMAILLSLGSPAKVSADIKASLPTSRPFSLTPFKRRRLHGARQRATKIAST